jgi:ribosomal protein S12 methylthiotransferase accessory factor
LVGITRLADVTWLDEIGIPVYQAIRPNALLLSVSQGKGATRELAKVSAAMEAIELWHAEHLPRDGALIARVGEVAGELMYDVGELDLARRHYLNASTCLEWIPATRLDTGEPSMVPATYLRLDGRVVQQWKPPLFQASTNGLASGNIYDEAVLHSLCELIERDAIAQAQEPGAIRHTLDLDTVGGTSIELLERFLRTGTKVDVEFLPHPTGVPVFKAQIYSDNFATVSFNGYGCHPEPDVALSRALAEAAQSRVTKIAGSREDVSKAVYRQVRHSRPSDAGFTSVKMSAEPSATLRHLQEPTLLRILQWW